MTEWRTVPGWPQYEVSNEGTVRRNGTIRITNLHKGKRYFEVCLSENGKVQNYDVHVLVCMAFHGPRPSPEHQVAHWDGDNFNNVDTNLRWATALENAADRLRHGTAPVGERNPNAKLTDEDVRNIRIAWKNVPDRYGCKVKAKKELAARYSVVTGTIESVVYNQRR